METRSELRQSDSYPHTNTDLRFRAIHARCIAYLDSICNLDKSINQYKFFHILITFHSAFLFSRSTQEDWVKAAPQGWTQRFEKLDLFCLMSHLCLVSGKNEVVLSHCGPERYLRLDPEISWVGHLCLTIKINPNGILQVQAHRLSTWRWMV
jgi:hypothetical protein